MQFILFLVLNAVLLLRPEELSTDLQGSRLYLWTSIACMVVTFGPLLDSLRSEQLFRRPMTVCIVGVWIAVALSDFARGLWGLGFEHAEEFFKNALLFLLASCLLDTPKRMQVYLSMLLGSVVVMAALGLAGYHGYLDHPRLQPILQSYTDPATGHQVQIRRMIMTGIFSDPNDLCTMLNLGVFIVLYRMTRSGAWFTRFFGVGVLILLGNALVATSSRGGMLGLLIGVGVFCVSKYGRQVGLLVALAVGVALLSIFAGRQTEITITGDTGNERLKLWAEGLTLWRHYPLFGIGYGNYADGVGQVAHNSFVHAYVELGFFGGAMFALAAYLTVVAPFDAPQIDDEVPGIDPEFAELCRFRPYLLGMVGAYMGGMLSLSRTYTLTTYLLFGIAAAFAGLTQPIGTWYRWDRSMWGRWLAVGVGTLLAHKLMAQFLTQWDSRM